MARRTTSTSAKAKGPSLRTIRRFRFRSSPSAGGPAVEVVLDDYSDEDLDGDDLFVAAMALISRRAGYYNGRSISSTQSFEVWPSAPHDVPYEQIVEWSYLWLRDERRPWVINIALAGGSRFSVSFSRPHLFVGPASILETSPMKFWDGARVVSEDDRPG
jgi:hypothetical protein